MKRKNKAILSLVTLSTVGIAFVTGLGLGLQSSYTQTLNTTTNENTDKGQNDAADKEQSITPGTSTSTNEVVYTPSSENYFSFSLTKLQSLVRLADSDKFVLSIKDNNKKEGSIYIIDDTGAFEQQKEVTPGQTIQVGVVFNQGYEDHTVRELKVFGSNPNHFVSTKQVEAKENVFEFKLPTIEESSYKDGTNWMYQERTQISVIPTFIKKSVGNEVDWEHGAYQDSLNGYVYELTKDAGWSEIKGDLWKMFENEDITDPIDIYFYLNGHTLTIDEAITEESLQHVASGWALHFYNNKYNKVDETNGYGEIAAKDGIEAIVVVKGGVYFGPQVKFNWYEYKDGIRFLNVDDNTMVGTHKFDPEKGGWI